MKKILFKEELLHAIIEGRKTQTRRIVTPQPNDSIMLGNELIIGFHGLRLNPRYEVGDNCYAAEPYAIANEGKCCYKYEPHNILFSTVAFENIKWKNKLFMPQKYARYFIEITAVRCERLQDISEADCIKEGIRYNVATEEFGGILTHHIDATRFKWYSSAKYAYATLIDSINGKGTWASNPYVWVYEFKLLS
jgi:hypothetical protein